MKNITFLTDDKGLQEKYQSAVNGLAGNVSNPYTVQGRQLQMPILVEGAVYSGIWLECGPFEGLVYGSMYNMEVAKANHRIFFEFQKEDGYLPCWIRSGKIGTGQIQMVVPIAKTAFEVYQQTKEAAFLEEAYSSCVRWDDWLKKYRDPRGLNLCELFCEYDTGHDRSNRFYSLCKGSAHECPDNDARICHNVGTLPWLAPDLSATLYGGRVALAAMAREMGRESEAEEWLEKAELTRRAILSHLYDPESSCFYDLDCNNRFVRIVSDTLTRVLCEHVADQPLFEQIFGRHIKNPYGFWTPYPLPSVAVSDPLYDPKPPFNSWCGPSQALTALRAPRWFEHYRKPSELTFMMKMWVKALVASPDFSQEMNPFTGEFSMAKKYSPSMCVMIDYTARLYGIQETGQQLAWNCRLPEQAQASVYEMDVPGGRAVLRRGTESASIAVGGKELYSVKGTCRVITNRNGEIRTVVGTEQNDVQVEVVRLYDHKTAVLSLSPNEEVEVNEGAYV